MSTSAEPDCCFCLIHDLHKTFLQSKLRENVQRIWLLRIESTKLAWTKGGIPVKFLVFRTFLYFSSKISPRFHSIEKWLHKVRVLVTVNVCDFLDDFLGCFEGIEVVDRGDEN